jgi:hypothetical protein
MLPVTFAQPAVVELLQEDMLLDRLLHVATLVVLLSMDGH